MMMHVLGVRGSRQRQPFGDGLKCATGGGEANARQHWRFTRQSWRSREQECAVGEGSAKSQLSGKTCFSSINSDNHLLTFAAQRRSTSIRAGTQRA